MALAGNYMQHEEELVCKCARSKQENTVQENCNIDANNDTSYTTRNKEHCEEFMTCHEAKEKYSNQLPEECQKIEHVAVKHKESNKNHEECHHCHKRRSCRRRYRELYVCPLVSAFPGIIGPALPCRYRIKCIIGQGSYSTVWALIDNTTEEMVVGKLSNITKESLHYVRGEAANMHLCKHHPFIVQHYKTYERHGRLLHILEYVDGGDLLMQVQARRKAMEEYKRVGYDSSTPINREVSEQIPLPSSIIANNSKVNGACANTNVHHHAGEEHLPICNSAQINSTCKKFESNATDEADYVKMHLTNAKTANGGNCEEGVNDEENVIGNCKHIFVPITTSTVATAITLPQIHHDECNKCTNDNRQQTTRSTSFRQQKLYEKQLERNRLRAEMDLANINAFYFDEVEVWMILTQMCLALQFMHQHNIIHHDLKTSNVMVVANGLIKIGDFGFSRQYETSVEGPDAVASVCCGTPSYLAPEIWHNRKYNGKADIWALGVILFELMTLEKPFQALTWDQLKLQILKSGMSGINQFTSKLSSSTYSSELTSLVCSMLNLDADQRPSTNQVLSLSLFQERALPLFRNYITRLRNIPDILRTNILYEVDKALHGEKINNDRIDREELIIYNYYDSRY